MLTDLLMNNPWLTPFALVVFVVGGPIAGARLQYRPRLTTALVALAVIVVLVLTLIPTSGRAYEFCAVQWSLPTPRRAELFGNVVLFVVPVLLIGVRIGRPAVALLVGSALSVLIELIQAVVPAIGRSCDTTDWLNNTIGAAIGALLAAAALRLAKRSLPTDR